MLIGALAIAIAATACGDDDTATTPTTATTTPEPVAVTVDGAPVPLLLACTGADDAVVTIAQGTQRRVILVREEGLALRIGTEGGTFAETADLQITRHDGRTRYAGSVMVEGQPTPVTIEIDDELDLPDC
jgi:hypothetical protein